MLEHIRNNTISDLLDDAFTEAVNDVLVDSSSLEDKEAYEDNTFPVDIIQFTEDAKYLNLSGVIYPEVKNLLIDVEQGVVREADLIMGKGSGKSMLAKIFSLYGIYFLGRLKNPHGMFRLTKDTKIFCGVVSISQQQAHDVIFTGVQSLVEQSEYFKSLKPVIKTREIDFPKNLGYFCGHSNATSFLGYATFRAVMDECNFMTDSSNRSVAKQLYSALRGSLKTRFPQNYKLLSISSDSTPASFLRERYVSLKERIKKETANDVEQPVSGSVRAGVRQS